MPEEKQAQPKVEEKPKPEKDEKQEKQERLIDTEISQEMQKAYIDYAMSVIVSRALPSVEDGLKPVQRRILYAMEKMGLQPNKQTKKSARIVGDTMGKYHPHGDTAIYDALARMTQDFSLRYPLVYGQGNWGCFTKDTKVKLTDGRNLSFIELIKEYKEGKKNYTSTINKKGDIEIAEIKNPRLTKKNQKILKIILDNNQEIKCTLNHKFMLRNGTYKEAKDLEPEDSLMPLYLKLSTEKDKFKPSLRGYQMVYQPRTNRWVLCHNLADDWNIKNNVYKKSSGRIRHHIDFNKLNNNPDNVRRIKWKNHWKFHAEHASKLHEDNSYKKKIAEGRKKFWANPKNREISSNRLSRRNIENWKKPRYREKMRRFLSKVNKEYMNKHPEKRRELSKRATRTLKKLWKDTEYRKKKSDSLKKKWKNPEYREEQSERMKKLSIKIWSNPKHRKYISNLSKKQWENGRYKENIINAFKNKWKTDLEFRNHVLTILSENGKKANYYGFLTVCRKTYELHNTINEENYEKVRILYNFRKGAGIIRFYIALEKFFNGDIEKLYKELGINTIKLNHKVKKIIFLDKREDVYDLTIDKTHNFALASGIFVHNSIDGDPVAAMRYTEAKLAPISVELLQDIEKETVKFIPNFDNSLKEPTIFPAKLPNMLINGATGIAVGMTTNIPPHNLTEVIDAIIEFINKPNITIEKLVEIVKGPDFPTGGYVVGDNIMQLYKTGKAHLVVRGKTMIEQTKSHERIAITEIPYQLNKSDLITEIARLIESKKLLDVSDLRDESAKGKIRIILELKKGANSKFTINRLYQYTRLQTRFDAVMIALVAGQPKLLNLQDIIREYVNYRKQVVIKRCKFELTKAQDRQHIVEGLLKALKQLDEVIATIKKSAHVSEALVILQKKFSLSQRQAQAILETRLQQLTALEQNKLKKEYEELKKIIAELQRILASEKEILQIIKRELQELKRKYGDTRRTYILTRISSLSEKDLIAKKDVVITITDKGYVKRIGLRAYHEQKRGGKGVIGAELATGDFVKQIITCSTHDYLLFFTNRGKVYWLKAYEIPEIARYGKGKALINLLSLRDETVTAVISVKKFENFLIMATSKGMVKKISLGVFSKPRKTGVRAINLPEDDWLINVNPLTNEEIMLVTKQGQAIRFNSGEVREMGRAAYGVTGIKLEKGDEVVSLEILPQEEAERKQSSILTITTKGYGKRSQIEDYRKTARAGKGVINIKTTAKTGTCITTVSVKQNDSIIVTTAKGMVIRVPVKGIRIMGRATQGVRIIKLQESDKVTDLIKIQKLIEE